MCIYIGSIPLHQSAFWVYIYTHQYILIIIYKLIFKYTFDYMCIYIYRIQACILSINSNICLLEWNTPEKGLFCKRDL